MCLLLITSQNKTADVFIKATWPKQFHDHIVKIGMVDVDQPPACEGVLAINREEEDKKKREAQVT